MTNKRKPHVLVKIINNQISYEDTTKYLGIIINKKEELPKKYISCSLGILTFWYSKILTGQITINYSCVNRFFNQCEHVIFSRGNMPGRVTLK